MEIFRKKNEATIICFPMVTTASPETFDTGETVTDTAYYSDAEGTFTSLAITDTVSEISTTGMYEISLTAAEMNHDLIIIKFTSTNASDTAVLIRTRAVDIDDLVRSTTPANTLDVSATGEAGIDWANIGSPTTAQNLSGTNIDVDQVVASVSGAVGSVTGHTNQTGDSYAIVNSGTFGNAQLVRATTPANTLDISATGEAGIDWANIGSPTTAQNLSGTNIDVDQVVASVSGNVDGSVASVTAAITLPTIPANWITAGGINAAALNGKGDWNIGKTGYDLNASQAGVTVGTVTTLTNLPAITAGWLTAAGIAASALDNKGNWNIGKTGYTVSTNSDKTGYSLVADSSAVTIGAISGHTAQTGDTYALANGASGFAAIDGNVDTLLEGIITGSTSGTPTTTSSNTNLTGYADDELIGRVIIFTGGTANGQASRITDYANTSGVVTYDTLTTAPAASDTFKIV